MKVGDWLSPRGHWDGYALVEAVNEDSVIIRRESQQESEAVVHSYVTRYWKVMRPNYQSPRDRTPPSWVEPGAKYTLFLDVAVYEVVEVRGVWVLSRDIHTGVLRFTRTKDIYRERPIPNRFQRVIG
jgi:hypothetical protein